MTSKSLINGEPGEHIAASDRGLQYGDGLFETLLVRNGSCEFWDRHMQRLLSGCERLRIPPPAVALLQREAASLLQGMQRAVLKIIITRGSGGRGYQPPQDVVPTRILRVFDVPDHPASHVQDGVCVRLCTQRLGDNTGLAGLKHLNRLEQVLARLEWDSPGIAEGLMLDRADNVIEGTFTNVFVVKNGCLRTPVLNHCGVAGIMRSVVMDLAAEMGVGCEVCDIPYAELQAADGIFLTNSVIGIWPVRELAGHRLQVGDLARGLQQALERLRETG